MFVIFFFFVSLEIGTRWHGTVCSRSESEFLASGISHHLMSKTGINICFALLYRKQFVCFLKNSSLYHLVFNSRKIRKRRERRKISRGTSHFESVFRKQNRENQVCVRETGLRWDLECVVAYSLILGFLFEDACCFLVPRELFPGTMGERVSARLLDMGF